MSRQPLAAEGDRRIARTRRRLAAYDRGLGVAFSLVCHVAIVVALLSVRAPTPPLQIDPRPVPVVMVDEQTLFPKPESPKPAPPAHKRPSPKPAAPTKSPPRRSFIRPTPARPAPESLAAGKIQADDSGTGLTVGQLAGAASADGGSGGGECDMARRVQSALRKDPLVRAAVTPTAGKAMMVWNGDWVKSHGEDGKGLSAVREAILWEVGFSPAACRAQAVHGLVLFSLNTPGGTARLAVGAGEWRWSDLLRLR